MQLERRTIHLFVLPGLSDWEPGYCGEAFYQDQLVVTYGDLITANATAPVDFASHILNKLQMHCPRVLDAWYSLFTTQDSAYFYAWQQAAAQERTKA